MSERHFSTYIGDAVYVYLDNYRGVVLYTSDGISETNRIVLEPEVLKAFKQWEGCLNERLDAFLAGRG